MRAGRILLLVFGSLLGMVSVGLLVSGAVLLWFNGSYTDDEGYFTTKSRTFESDSYAIITEDMLIEVDAPGWVRERWFDTGDLGAVKVTVSNLTQGKEVFVGLARASDVEAYLAVSEYDVLTQVSYWPFEVKYERHPGSVAPAPPSSQTFWEAQARGTGTQQLDTTLEEGVWTLVTMNGDASRDVRVEATVGIKVPYVFGTGLGLVLGGVFLFLVSTGMVVLGLRRPR
jgi:hypothetical protein